MKLFALSDIHGRTIQLNDFEDLGFDANNEEHMIVILGDYFDRFDDNHGVYLTMVELKERFGDRVLLIIGNHDGFMREFIETTLALNTIGKPLKLEPILQERWLRNGGDITMEQCFLIDQDAKLYNKDIKERLESYKKFNDALEGYVDLGNYIFTHAGVSADYEVDFWTRDYIYQDNPFKDKTVVIGHTPFKYALEHEDLELMDAPSGVGKIIINKKLKQNIILIDSGEGNNIVLFE